jgi:tetratricopeptide (TPR) repeat protein
MTESIHPKALNEFNHGDDALEAGDRARARFHFVRAVSFLEDVEQPKQRRDELAALALALLRRGFGDVASPALNEVIKLDDKRGARQSLGIDFLRYAWARLQAGDLNAAWDNFERARELSLEYGDHANAAAASTNMAIVISQDKRRLQAGGVVRAIGLLRESLGFLKKAEKETKNQQEPSLEETQITTRVALIQALAVSDADPEDIFKLARELYNRFGEKLRQDQWHNTLGPIRDTIKRLQAKGFDVNEFEQRFPELQRHGPPPLTV